MTEIHSEKVKYICDLVAQVSFTTTINVINEVMTIFFYNGFTRNPETKS